MNGGSGGTSAGSAGSAGSGGFAGSGGSGAGGSADSGGPGGGGCGGLFGAPSVVYSDAPHSVGSPELPDDELELYFVRREGPSDAPTAFHFMVSRRQSKDVSFPAGALVPELDAFCAQPFSRSLDISPDGLRVYASCHVSDQKSDLMFAERPNRMTPFGALRSIASLGQSVGLSRNELEVYVSNYATLKIARALRSSVAQMFGPSMELTLGDCSSAARLCDFVTPSVSADGLELYAAVPFRPVVGVSTRQTVHEEFGPAVDLHLAPREANAAGSPEISGDCRSLYFVIAQTGTDPWPLYVAKR